MTLNNLTGTIGLLASRALVLEVGATPKPGLVDRDNSGAHKDMNLQTFLHSARAITPYLTEMAQVGFAATENPEKLFPALKEIGLRAEQAMSLATNGVNTHKGAIFSVGLVSAAAGFAFRREGRFHADDILTLCAQIAGDAVREDFIRMDRCEPKTHGELLYRNFGSKGIRGEVAAGFPSVQAVSLPALRETVHELSLNDALVHTLLCLMAKIEDTNVLSRGGEAARVHVWARARQALELGGMLTPAGRREVLDMDTDFIERNISPGGCADLLAVTLLLFQLEQA